MRGDEGRILEGGDARHDVVARVLRHLDGLSEFLPGVRHIVVVQKAVAVHELRLIRQLAVVVDRKDEGVDRRSLRHGQEVFHILRGGHRSRDVQGIAGIRHDVPLVGKVALLVRPVVKLRRVAAAVGIAAHDVKRIDVVFVVPVAERLRVGGHDVVGMDPADLRAELHLVHIDLAALGKVIVAHDAQNLALLGQQADRDAVRLV